MNKIAIVDYNMGNLASVKNAFNLLGCKAELVSDAQALLSYSHAILPGVGAFGDAMEHLKSSGMDEAIKTYAKQGGWLLGICLGMQVLFNSSDEFGHHEGLGLIQGDVRHFDSQKFSHELKVPHMGWNRLFNTEHPLFNALDKEHYLYFVHSYHVHCDLQDDEIGFSEYGYRFSSAVAHNNILGIQPHPEKSHKNGLKILENFINL